MVSNNPSTDTSIAAPTTKPKIVYGIQILRAVAAILVVLRHCAKGVTDNSETAFAAGQAGVDIFFVISGVVIYLTGRKLDWHVFFRRRIARIVPLYWFVLILTLLGDVARHQWGGSLWISNAALSFFFIPAWAPNGTIFPPIVVGWTLNFEMWFYLVCTAALLLFARGAFLRVVSIAITLAILVGLPLLAMNGWEPTPALVPLMPISLEFVAGLWLAHLWSLGKRFSPSASVALIVAAIAWLILAPWATPMTVWRPLAWGIPAVALVAAVLSLEERLPFGQWKLGLILGDASYALYLIHPVVLGVEIALVKHFMPDLSLSLLFALLAISALVSGVLLHFLIELRILAVANRLLGLRPSANRSGTQSAALATKA